MELVQSQTIRLAKLGKQKMNEVEKKPNHLGTLETIMFKELAQKMATSSSEGTKSTPRNETDFTQRGEQRRDQHQKTKPTTRDETDFTERGKQRWIKKQHRTKSTPRNEQSRDGSKK